MPTNKSPLELLLEKNKKSATTATSSVKASSSPLDNLVSKVKEGTYGQQPLSSMPDKQIEYTSHPYQVADTKTKKVTKPLDVWEPLRERTQTVVPVPLPNAPAVAPVPVSLPYTSGMESKQSTYADTKGIYTSPKAVETIPKLGAYVTGMEDKKAAYTNPSISPITKMESKEEAYKPIELPKKAFSFDDYVQPDTKRASGTSKAHERASGGPAIADGSKIKDMVSARQEAYDTALEIAKHNGWIDNDGNYIGPKDKLKDIVFGQAQLTWQERQKNAEIGKQLFLTGNVDFSSDEKYNKMIEKNPQWLTKNPEYAKAYSVEDWKKPGVALTKTFRDAVDIISLRLQQLPYGMEWATKLGILGAVAGSATPGLGTAGGFVGGAGAGYTVGGGMYMAFMEGGSAYRDYIEQGMSPEVAKVAAIGTGLVNSYLEEVLGTRIGQIPGFNRMISNTMAKGIKDFAVEALGEVTEEGAQEAVSITFGEIGKVVDSLINKKPIKNTLLDKESVDGILSGIIRSGAQESIQSGPGLIGSMVLGIPGGAATRVVTDKITKGQGSPFDVANPPDFAGKGIDYTAYKEVLNSDAMTPEQEEKIKQAPSEFNWALKQVLEGKAIPSPLEKKYPVLVEFRENLKAEKGKAEEIKKQTREKEVKAIVEDYNSLFNTPKVTLEDKNIPEVKVAEKAAKKTPVLEENQIGGIESIGEVGKIETEGKFEASEGLKHIPTESDIKDVSLPSKIEKVEKETPIEDINPVKKSLEEAKTKVDVNNYAEESKEVENVSFDNTYDRAEKFITTIEKGETITLDNAKREAQFIVDNEDKIKNDLRTMKNADLDKRLSYMQRGQYKTKDEMVKAIYDNMLSQSYYNLSGEKSLSYALGSGNYLDMLKNKVRDAINKLTPELLEKTLTTNKNEYAESVERRKAYVEGIKNPKTLEDYSRKEKVLGLTAEEQDKFDDLYARDKKVKRQEERNKEAERKAESASRVIGDTDKFTISKDKHTKTGEDVWIVKLNERVESEEWKEINSSMKSLGGNWWRGNQGWNFKADPTEKLKGDVSKEIETKAEVKQNNKVAKLRELADNMQNSIDDMNRPRLANTAKRAREAASIEESAKEAERLQQTIRNIADAIDNGDVELIDQIDSKIQIETLESILQVAKYNRSVAEGQEYKKKNPNDSQGVADIQTNIRRETVSEKDIRYAELPVEKLNADTVKSIARDIAGKKGFLKIAARLQKAVVDAKDGKVIINSQLREDLDKIIKEPSISVTNWVEDYMAKRKRLERMGIESVAELKAYLREYMKYRDKGKAIDEKERAIKEKERSLIGKKIEGYFPTPKIIVEQMLDLADIQEGETVLEPSAGKGNIADLVREQNPDNPLDVIEWDNTLSEILTDKGHNVVGDDFLKHTGEYDKIVMNPPFEKGQDMEHVTHAFELLNPRGRVVAIMSPHFTFANDKKSKEFKDFLDSNDGTWEKLPEGSFKTSERPTGVNTVLVVIDKAAETKTEQQAEKETPKAEVELSKQEPQTDEEKREEFAEEVKQEGEEARRLSEDEVRSKINDLNHEIRTTQEKMSKTYNAKEKDSLQRELNKLNEKKKGYSLRISKKVDNPKSNTDKLQNALIDSQLTIEGLEITGTKKYGFDKTQREVIAEKLIEGNETDKEKIKIEVPDDGTMEVVNSEPIIADIMNELGIKKTEMPIPYNMEKNAGHIISVDKNSMWATPNGYYAAKVTVEEMSALKDLAKNRDIKFGEVDFSSIKEATANAKTELKETPKLLEGKEGKKKVSYYLFKVGDGIYTFDKKYFDIFNNDGNRFYVTESNTQPAAIKTAKGDLIGIVLPVRTTTTVDEYDKLNPATGKEFFSKAKKKKEKTSSMVQALTGEYPQMPRGDGSSNLKDTKTVDEIVKIIEKSTGIPIRTGKFRQRAYGIFKNFSEVARTKVSNDLPVICHEIGHALDKKHSLNSKAYNDELNALGMQTSRASYSAEKVRGEGVAEFVRLYLTNPTEAQTLAPKFLAYFESVVDRSTLDALNSIRTDILNVVNLKEVDKVINDMSIGEKRRTTTEKESGIRAMLSRAYDAWLDEYAPFTRLQKRAEKEGYAGENLDTATRLYRGVESKVLGNLTLAQSDLEGNVIGKSFNEIMKPIKKGELNEFRAYMTARRAIDYENRGMVLPQSYAVYSDTLNVLDNKHSHFAEVFEDIRTWSENELQLLVESGVMSQEAADTINDMNPNYVPLQRILEAIEVVHGGSGSSLGQSKNILKRAKGSGKTIIDPLESLISNAFIIRRAAEANKINGMLYDMARTVEGFGDVVEIVPPGLKGFKFNVEEIGGVLQQILKENIQAEIDLLADDDPMRDVLIAQRDEINVKDMNLDKLVTLFRANYRERDGEITYYQNGKPILMQLDRPLYMAVKGLGYDKSHSFIRALNVPKKIIQAGAVTTVRFMAWNMARDTFGSIMQSEAGVNLIDILDGYKSAFLQDKWYRDWVLHGGSTDFLMASDREKAQDILFDEVLGYSMSDKLKDAIANPSKENLKRLIFHTVNTIRRGVEWSEAGPKVAEFKKLQVEKGMTAIEAAKLSREVNQDFLKYGYVGKELNKITAFFNANIWGIKRIEETFRAHPFRTMTRGMLYITLPTMFFYFLNDENEKYKKMNVWRKALFYNIPLGDPKTAEHFLPVPKPYGWGWIFGVLPEITLDVMRKEDPNGWKDLKEAFIVHFDVPILPSALGPAFDVSRNKSWNQTIIESMADRNKPSYLRYNERTSVAAKGITNVLKDVPLANKLSPKQLDYLVKGYTGSVGDFFWKLPDTIKGIVVDPGDYSKYPLARSVVVDSTYSSRSMDDFYTNGEELNTRLNEAKEIGEYRAISHLPEPLQNELSGSIVNATKEYNSLAKKISDGRKAMREIEENDKYTPAEKRVRKREIQIKINKLADEFNTKYERFKKVNKIE